MKIIQFYFMIIFLFISVAVFAQKENVKEEKTKKKNNFTVDLDHKIRFESTPSVKGRSVLSIENTTTDISLGQRARLIFGSKSKKLNTKISIQDVRTFGNKKMVELDVHEAWAKYLFVNSDKKQLGLKLGRQELNFDQKIISNKNWNLQSVAYDAVTLECDNNEFDIKWRLGLAYNSVDLLGHAEPYRILGYIYFNKKFKKILQLKLSNLYENFEQDSVLENGIQDSTYYTNTVGINPIFTVSSLIFDAGFYYQKGKQKDLISSIFATSYYVNLSYELLLGKKKSVIFSIGYDNYSGRAYNDTSDIDVNKVFSVPYAENHKYFGNTDFHLVMFKKGHGASDLNFKALCKYNNTSVELALHKLSYAETSVYTNADGTNVEFNSIGNNIDLVIKQKLGEKMEVLLGYSLMIPTDNYIASTLGYNLEGDINKAKKHNFAWIMFSFTPNLFNSK